MPCSSKYRSADRTPYISSQGDEASDIPRDGAGGTGREGVFAGRLGSSEYARTETLHEGRVPLHTLRADIDYATATAHTTLGAIGVKVWIYKGDIIPEYEKFTGEVKAAPAGDEQPTAAEKVRQPAVSADANVAVAVLRSDKLVVAKTKEHGLLWSSQKPVLRKKRPRGG